MFDWFQDFVSWLNEQFEAIRALLDPMRLIVSAAETVAEQMPEKDPNVQAVADGFRSALHIIGPYFSYLDFFVDLRIWLVVIGIVTVMELGIHVFRLWRMVRSFIT